MNSNKLNLLLAAVLAVFMFSPAGTYIAVAQTQRPGGAQHGVRPGAQQGGRNFNPVEIRKKVRNFITSEAGLTQREADIVFPIFFEVKDQQRNLKQRIDNACQRVRTERLSEYDCQKILSEVQRMQRQFGDLGAGLYDRLRQRGIPASKLLRIKAADEKFRRSIFRNATNGSRR